MNWNSFFFQYAYSSIHAPLFYMYHVLNVPCHTYLHVSASHKRYVSLPDHMVNHEQLASISVNMDLLWAYK